MNIYGNKKLALLFLLPALLLLLLFVYYPIAESFVLSLYRWKAFSSERVYVGLEYYRKLFSDAVFYTALKNNVLYSAISIVFQVRCVAGYPNLGNPAGNEIVFGRSAP